MGRGPNPPPSSLVSSDADESESGESCKASRSVVDTDKKPLAQVFKGHLNQDTVKGVSFFGPKCEYVVSGSNCGRIFMWRRKDGELLRAMEADKHVVNCIEAHPQTAFIASSGIETDIKIWTPKAEERATLLANKDELRPRRRGWTFHVSSPQELLLQSFSLDNHLSSPVQSGGYSLFRLETGLLRLDIVIQQQAQWQFI